MDQALLQRRARLGVFWLAARTAVQQLIGLAGTVYLARVLGPKEFGAFWIVQFVLAAFTLFGDAGFGAALIQKKAEATDAELSSVFWAQLLLGVAVVIAVFFAAPWVVRLWPGLPPSGIWMLRALSLSLLLTSSRVIPAILLERQLLFGRLSVIDLVLTASFNGAAALLAARGYGTYALVGGVLVQGVAGLVAAYSMRPWLPALRIDLALLRPIMRFGVTFQAKHMAGFVNAAVMPLYAGSALGTYAFGLVSWSQTTGFFPVQIVMILARVNFPLLSRLQHDPEAFGKTLGATVKVCALVTLLFVMLFLGLGPGIVQVIYGGRWLPALPTLYVFATAISIGFIVPIMNGALDALGKPQIMMRLGISWTVLNWLVVLGVMQLRHDALSFSIAYCVHVLVSNLAVIYVVSRLLPAAHVWRNIWPGFVAGSCVAALARIGLLPWVRGPFSLAAAALLAIAGYAGLIAVLDARGFRALVQLLRKQPSAAA
jgi:teichuronic acid exporter